MKSSIQRGWFGSEDVQAGGEKTGVVPDDAYLISHLNLCSNLHNVLSVFVCFLSKDGLFSLIDAKGASNGRLSFSDE